MGCSVFDGIFGYGSLLGIAWVGMHENWVGLWISWIMMAMFVYEKYWVTRLGNVRRRGV